MPNNRSASTSERHIYVLTSNGDWMDMTPQLGGERPEVFVLAVDVQNRDELYDAADHGAGQLLGRLIIADDGRPMLE